MHLSSYTKASAISSEQCRNVQLSHQFYLWGGGKRHISQKIHSDSNRNNFSSKENGQSFSILLLILPKNAQLCKIRAFEFVIIGLLLKHSSRSKDNKLITLKKFQEIKMNENKS